jgi:hypothetical protein
MGQVFGFLSSFGNSTIPKPARQRGPSFPRGLLLAHPGLKATHTNGASAAERHGGIEPESAEGHSRSELPVQGMCSKEGRSSRYRS